MQSGQYETFEQHFQNGTIIEYRFEAEMREPFDPMKGHNVDIGRNKITLTFSIEIANYKADFEVIGNSELVCAIDAEKILNKLMN